MQRMSIDKPMVSFAKSRERLAKTMNKSAELSYPIGSEWEVEVRTGVVIRAVVTGHGLAWWSNPGMVLIRNLKTGKTSSFYPHQNKHRPLTAAMKR